MNKLMKIVIGLIIGIVVFSIIGVLLNVVVGIAAFALKAIILIAVLYFFIKVGQKLIKKFK